MANPNRALRTRRVMLVIPSRGSSAIQAHATTRSEAAAMIGMSDSSTCGQDVNGYGRAEEAT